MLHLGRLGISIFDQMPDLERMRASRVVLRRRCDRCAPGSASGVGDRAVCFSNLLGRGLS